MLGHVLVSVEGAINNAGMYLVSSAWQSMTADSSGHRFSCAGRPAARQTISSDAHLLGIVYSTFKPNLLSMNSCVKPALLRTFKNFITLGLNTPRWASSVCTLCTYAHRSRPKSCFPPENGGQIREIMAWRIWRERVGGGMHPPVPAPSCVLRRCF